MNPHSNYSGNGSSSSDTVTRHSDGLRISWQLDEAKDEETGQEKKAG